MKKSAAAWALAGVIAGFAGLATAWLVTQVMNLRLDPVGAAAELVHDRLPGGVVDWARGVPGPSFTTPGLLIGLAVAFAVVGRLGRRARWVPAVGFVAIAALGVVAVLRTKGATAWWLLPVGVGLVTMVVAMLLLGERLRRLQALPDDEVFGPTWQGRRRDFLVVAGLVVGVSGLSVLVGRFAGRDVREVEAERLARVRTVSAPQVPPAARLEVDGLGPWMTPVEDFYVVDTAVVKPAIKAQDWRIRIHGLVENEIELSFEELVDRGVDEAWITMTSATNEVGGDLVGNAWFSGVLLAPLLAQAGPLDLADAVLQTSHDGWTCLTPLDTLTDGRRAMLAIAMNGEQLTIEHGYPVRTVVPGLFGYVSATKWVVDLEVTRFDRAEGYWTTQGRSERAPVKLSSRIAVPGDGASVPAGPVVVAGTAWAQGSGIASVEVQVDGGGWAPAELGGAPNPDTWVQWRHDVDLEPGEHTVFVRTTDRDGRLQTAVVTDVLPDGATGWHSIAVTAT